MVIYVALIAILNLGLGYALAVYLGAGRAQLATTIGDAAGVARSLRRRRRRVAAGTLLLRCQLEDRLDLDRPSAGQRSHAHRAARSDAVLRAEHIAHQFAEAVDHGRMILEIRRRVDEADVFTRRPIASRLPNSCRNVASIRRPVRRAAS